MLAHEITDNPPKGQVTVKRLLVFKSLFVRNSKFLATFSSATCKHPTAIGSSHALAETVFVFSFLSRGLKGTLHNGND
jgi:hypothetical protein